MLIQTDRLTKIYGNGDNTLRALDSVTLSIERGEFVAVVAPAAAARARFCTWWGH